MKITVMVPKEVDLRPGQKVYIQGDFYITKIVQTMDNLYAVMSDGVWRPFSTYEVTWTT